MRTTQLEYFIAAAETLSFTEAAKRCQVAQPAISQQIHRLEAELGFELFSRNPHGLMLTEAGELYYRDAVKALRQLDMARERARIVASGLSGALTIGACGPSQGSDLFLIEQFREVAPNVELAFVGVNTRWQGTQLINGEYDVLFTDISQLALLPNVKFARTETRSVCVMANRANPIAKRRSVTFEEILDQTLIFAEPSEMANGASPFNGGTGRRLYSDTQENVQLMLRLDMGVAVAPDSVATAASDDIVIIPTSGPWPTITLGWCYLDGNTNPALGEFLQFLESTPTDIGRSIYRPA